MEKHHQQIQRDLNNHQKVRILDNLNFFHPCRPPSLGAREGLGKRRFPDFGPLRATFAKDTFSFEDRCMSKARIGENKTIEKKIMVDQ